MFKNEKVEVNQEWKGKQVSFDPDSSPKAWKHYKKYYEQDFQNNYNYDDLKTFDYIEHGENKGSYAVNKYLRYYNRLNILPIDYNIDNEWSTSAVQRLSGETDFNFNDKKFDEFIQLLLLDKNNYINNLKKLDKCSKMHHTLLNFSIMPVMGNLQGYKSKGIFLDVNNQKYEWLDRLDSFVFLLDKFYKSKENGDSDIIKHAGTNKYELINYLNNFAENKDDESIYNYCKKIYFIDKPLVDKLKASGKKPIDSAERVVEYMNLALEFWQEKEFCLLKDEFLTIGDYFPNGGETYTLQEIVEKIYNDLLYEEEEADYLINKCIERGFIDSQGRLIHYYQIKNLH